MDVLVKDGVNYSGAGEVQEPFTVKTRGINRAEVAEKVSCAGLNFAKKKREVQSLNKKDERSG